MRRKAQHDYAKIAAKYAAGSTIAAVAAEFHCGLETVSRALRAHGIQPRSVGRKAGVQAHHVIEAAKVAATMRDTDATFREIGDALGVTRQRAFQLCQIGCGLQREGVA